MLNLAEYRKTATGLADYLPWASLVAPGIVLNKDGSFQRTIRYRGPDLDSATDAELVAVSARLNNVLRRFGEGWALFFEAERVPANQSGCSMSARRDTATKRMSGASSPGSRPKRRGHLSCCRRSCRRPRRSMM
jgi:type IV secretion system protein VirB4